MMIIRIGLSMVPRGRRWDSSTPMFSTLVMSTIYSSEEESSDESGEAEVARCAAYELRQRLQMQTHAVA